MIESTSTPSAPEKDAPPATPPSNPLEALAAALKAERERDEPAETATETGDPKKPAAKAKPKDLTKLAETLGMEVKDLYGIEIPSSRQGEQPYTLGKLKDLAAEQDAFTVRSLQLEETARAREAKLAQAEREVEALVGALPKEALKPELRKALSDRYAQTVSTERQRTLEVIPEWADESKRTGDLKGMLEHLRGYGFADDYLTRLVDHRALKFVRDAWMRETQIRAALAKVTERKPQTPPKSNAQPPKRKPASGPLPIEQQKVREFMNVINRAGN